MDRNQSRKRAEELVSKMTVKEKASQLLFSSPAIPRLGIPAYNWWNEALHGVARAGTATVFPQSIALAATFDTKLVYKVADAISTEGRAKYNIARNHGDHDIYKGLTFWSPNVNIFRDPRWGRGQETYGEDPYLTSMLGIEFVKGLQGNGEYMKAAACAKHFAVHSGPEDLRHSFDAIASKKDMAETYLPAFKALVEDAGVEAVMGAYNRTNGEACNASPYLQHILREEWGFEGHFVSDCWALRDIHESHHITKNAAESAALALKNGCDLNCGCTYNHLIAALARDHEDVHVAQLAHMQHGADLLARLDGDDIHDVRAPRGPAGLRYLVALLAVDPAEVREEEDVVVGRGGEHRLHIVLLAGGHGADALAAAALGAVFGGGQALYIAAVGEGVDALLLLDEVLDVYLVLDVLDLGLARVAELVAQGGQLVLQDALYLLGVGQQALVVGDALLQLGVFALQLLPVEALERLEAHVEYRLGLYLVKPEAGHEVLPGVVVALTDDADDLVDVVLGYEQALQQVLALLRLPEVVAGPAGDELLLELEVLVDDMPQGEYLSAAASGQRAG